MRQYYWSGATYDPELFHSETRCGTGRRIKKRYRRQGVYPPIGFRRCHECVPRPTRGFAAALAVCSRILVRCITL